MNTDELAEEKKRLEALQDAQSEMITEADIAAGADEGMDTLESHPLSEDVSEDRDSTPFTAIDPQ